MPGERKLTTSSHEFPFGQEWFRTKRLTENVLGIYEPFHDEQVLSYLIIGSKGSALIDTGMGFADISAISDTVRNATALLSHSHWDHIGGVAGFENMFIFDNPYETERLKKGWLPEEIIGYSEKHFHTKLPKGFLPKEFSIPGNDHFSTLTDNELINLGNITIQVIHTPGHTPGSICFFIPEKGFLFTGDTLYAGPEYLHLSESDPNKYFSSLEKLKRIVNQNLKVIFPGHNNFTEPPELLDQHILASQGKLEPVSVNEGLDEFGAYVEKKWESFSLKLPPSALDLI